MAKPDYLAALMGLIACSCAFFLFSQQRQGPMTETQLAGGLWNVTYTTQMPTEKMGTGETFSSLLRFNISKKSQAFGFIEPHNEEEGGERAIAMFLRENAGTVTVESDVMGEIGFDFTFSVADLNPGSYDASRVLTGEYSGMRGKGRAEVTLTANTFFATVVNATANEPFTTIIGDRIQAETKKPTQFMDQVFLGLMVFAVAAVVNIVRSALFPKQKVR